MDAHELHAIHTNTDHAFTALQAGDPLMSVVANRSDGRCFLAYLTANDRSRYLADFLHFRHMARRDPGVRRIEVYMAISRVQPFAAVDRAAIAGLVAMSAKCPWLHVRAVFWKGNLGRDFSSAEACLQAIGAEASADDYVMIRNRSAYGPARDSWYRQYIDQYERFPNTGLVGSTINFAGHPKRPSAGPTTHVQTYAYLSQWRHFQPLAAAYPAARCVHRLELINDGEIGLSRAMLERGLGLSCLYWPERYFSMQQLCAEHLPQTDVKANARSLPLRYKYPAYFANPRDLPAQVAWSLRLQADQRLQRTVRDPIRQVTLDRYG